MGRIDKGREKGKRKIGRGGKKGDREDQGM